MPNAGTRYAPSAPSAAPRPPRAWNNRGIAAHTQSAPRKRYAAAVVATAGAHFAYLLYVPGGGFLALRWPRTLIAHIAAVGWGVAVVALRLPCPLTALEDWARRRAELEPLPPAGFIDRYIEGQWLPTGRVGVAQAAAFAAAAASWGVVAAHRSGREVGAARRGGRRGDRQLRRRLPGG